MSTFGLEETRPEQPRFMPAPALANSRYNRQMLIPSISLKGQERISSTRVLVVGLGGLGSPASLYLAGAGVHTLGLLDHDVVEESNLHRQIVHRESSLHNAHEITEQKESGSMTKAQSALRGCRDLNSTIQYRVHEVRLDGANALGIFEDYDIVLDCTDNPATRYLISDVCVVLGKILISGAAQRLDGQVMALNYIIPQEPKAGSIANGLEADAGDVPTQRGPCYRCVFPVPPSPEMVQGCSEIGILGPVVGTIGCLMASETLRQICRPDEIRKPTMLLYNAWSIDPRSTFRTIGLRGRRLDCMACGDLQVLRDKGKQKLEEAQIREGIMDYEEFCGRMEDVHILQDGERIHADAFLNVMQSNHDCLVVDVREEIEVQMGPKIKGSINIPISKILRSEGTKSQAPNGQSVPSIWDMVMDGRKDSPPVYFVCQRGNDSQIAARRLMDHTQTYGHKTRWVGDVKGGFMAMENHARQN